VQGHPTKFPIVFCRYMHLMKTKVYKWDAIIQQIVAGINTYFKYFKEQDNYTIINKDMFILNIAFLLYYIFKASNATNFNKQL
jgi:UDP-N-acetylmuramyl pentapeptide phosphotransferase/UDP-N-acetylglucosamine-1-phosphate transferase